MNLIITPTQVQLDKGYLLGTTPCAFGNVVSVFQNEFPIKNYADTEVLTETIVNLISGKEKQKCIWGLYVNASILHTIYSFFDNKDKIVLTLKDVENFRITHNITATYLPINAVKIDDGIKFCNIKSAKEIVYGLLFYYAYNDYKLVKCEHCGRWFATKTLKNKYCPRNSTFLGYTKHNCEQAVRNISQELQREKKRIYNSMTIYTTNYGNEEINNFLDKCSVFREKIKNRASVENLSEYWEFLKNYKDGVNNG